MGQRKRSAVLHPKRRAYRVPRVDSADLSRVFDVVNGQVYRPERFNQARKEISEVLLEVIRHCDAIEEALAGIYRFTDANSGREITQELKTRDERVEYASRIALRVRHVFGPLHGRKFQVMAIPGLDESSQKLLNEKLGSYWKETAQQYDESGSAVQWEVEQIYRRPGALPYAEDLFRLGAPLIWPDGNVEVQLYWEFIQGLSRLDDLRRIRVCEHCKKFHLRKKVQRQPHYFCVDSDECGKAFHNQKQKEKGIEDGRKHSRQK